VASKLDAQWDKFAELSLKEEGVHRLTEQTLARLRQV